jgi:predicted MFS family arabinose efflux permease
VTIDYLGAALIMGGVSTLLVWVSLAGTQFDWVSTATAAMVGAGVLMLALAVVVEMRATEPIIPLRLFRDRTTTLATLASVMVGVAMFGSTVFLSQYYQLARGMSPTTAGLMSIPMVGGLMLSSMISGRRITATGFWKRYLVGGMTLVVVSMVLLSTIDEKTSLVVVGAYTALLGVGMGAALQNLVLAVQNNAAQADMGAASSVVAVFRTMGGSIGVSALGAALGHQVSVHVVSGLTALGIKAPSVGDSRSVPNLSELPAPVRQVFEHAFGAATAHIFVLATPIAALALVAVLFIREVPLRLTLDRESELARPKEAEAGA